MKFLVAVLIAAVTVNCLVTAINGKAASDTLPVPYTDMLLPPFEDATTDNNNKDKDVAATELKINVASAKETKTTASTTTTTTTTTKKPITNEVNNNLPELSIEALLPPLFEPKIEEEETKKTTTTKTTTQKPTTTTQKPTTTTKAPTTTTTTIRTTTTPRPVTTTTTTTKPKIDVPELFLDSLLPPLLDNDIEVAKDTKVVFTTQKPSVAFKTTKKSYYQQQQTQHSKDLHTNDQKHLLKAGATKEVKQYNKPIVAVDKHTAESKTQPKQVPLAAKQQDNKLQRNVEIATHQHVAKQVVQSRHSASNTKYDDKHYNYSFDFYLGTTTPRPAKSGLPTITPFPHRLGR